jgi:cytochrome c biogenesis protein CcmG/thiol:disulfide interchange protein DsbE
MQYLQDSPFLSGLGRRIGARVESLRARQLSRRTLLTTAAAVLVALLLLSLLLARLVSATHTVATIQQQQQSVLGGLVGHSAPDFTIPLWNGAPGARLHLSALRGHVVVVNFWASWCDPCHVEAPVLTSIAKAEAAHGVIFLGVALETENADGISFLHQYHVVYDCGPAPDSLAVTYGLTGIPVTMTITAKGSIAAQLDGPVTVSSLDAAIQKAIR